MEQYKYAVKGAVNDTLLSVNILAKQDIGADVNVATGDRDRILVTNNFYKSEYRFPLISCVLSWRCYQLSQINL